MTLFSAVFHEGVCMEVEGVTSQLTASLKASKLSWVRLCLLNFASGWPPRWRVIWSPDTSAGVVREGNRVSALGRLRTPGRIVRCFGFVFFFTSFPFFFLISFPFIHLSIFLNLIHHKFCYFPFLFPSSIPFYFFAFSFFLIPCLWTQYHQFPTSYLLNLPRISYSKKLIRRKKKLQNGRRV